MNNLTFATSAINITKPFAGQAASNRFDGASAVQVHMTTCG
jgi:hypothetical protein